MNIEGTRATPSVFIGPGKIEIKGRSIPEDSIEFYNPVHYAVKDYFQNNAGKTEVIFHLEYINSGSKKLITNILITCNDYFNEGRDVVINWYYDPDDESIEELGEDLKAMIQIPFHIKPSGK
ncbi:MAG: DUF1987 domain-containing protein [Bacteroidales bacterium]|nr:DUF1987 domain-containing protein [Bacteroidales bacterium]MCB8999200.1 DUF1987 domain-containing protein [Bacteroidales bacterium]